MPQQDRKNGTRISALAHPFRKERGTDGARNKRRVPGQHLSRQKCMEENSLKLHGKGREEIRRRDAALPRLTVATLKILKD